LRIKGDSDYQPVEDVPYQIASHLRAGKILPILVSERKHNGRSFRQFSLFLQSESRMSIEESFSQSDYGLFAALDCDKDARMASAQAAQEPNVCFSSGKLALKEDDGFSTIDMRAGNNLEGGFVELDEANWSLCGQERSGVSSIVVYGLTEKPSQIFLPDGVVLNVTQSFSDQAFYEADLERMQVTSLPLDFCTSDMLRMEWDFSDEPIN